MSKRILIIFVLGGLLIGCRPHGILSRREMQAVLVDMHKTDAIMQASGYTSSAYADVESKAYFIMLQKHHITQAQFDSSLVWYTKHPQLFDKIYPKVTAQLEQERDAFLEAHPQTIKPQKKPARILPDLDRTLFSILEGMLIDRFDIGEKYEKSQKSDEIFVYIKINS